MRGKPASLHSPEGLEEPFRRRFHVANPAIAFGIVDATGVVLAMSSGLPRDRTITLSDRPQFQHHRDHPDDRLHVSAPYLSRPNSRNIFTLSRRLAAEDGTFLGMAAATIEGDRIFDLFANLERGKTHRLVIARSDGIVLGCVPFCAIGASIAGRAPITRAAAGEMRGIGRGVAPVDGQRVVTAFHGVKGFPIIALSATNEQELTQRWWQQARLHLAVAVAAVALATGLGILQLRTLWRRLVAERALRVSSQNLLRTGIDALRHGFAVLDRAGSLRIWNRHMTDIFPYLADELREGRSMRDLAALVLQRRRPELRPEMRERLLDRILRMVGRPGGPHRWIESDGRVIEASNHATSDAMTVLLFRDVTEQERQAKEVQRSLVMERESNALQQRFVAIVSHEFRTPLSIIDSSAQIIAGSLPPQTSEGVHKRVQRIRDGVRQLVQLIDRILSSARQADGRIERQDETFDLVALVRSICEQHAAVNPSFTIRPLCDRTRLEVFADPRLIEHTLSNLVSNAVKYSGHARSVEVELRTGSASTEIAVRDHGIGIPESELPGIFKRFYRASTAKGLRGTGLGLNLARELVVMHGGTIEVSSTLGAGSTFTIRLPLIAPPIATQRPAA